MLWTKSAMALRVTDVADGCAIRYIRYKIRCHFCACARQRIGCKLGAGPRDETICRQVVDFIEHHHACRVAMVDRIIGCPHEEGIDYPKGKSCPLCPFWKGRDRWTGLMLQ
jgi:hypothetical protein